MSLKKYYATTGFRALLLSPITMIIGGTPYVIGYSFRYFTTGVGIKHLAINGIEPTAENIRNGIYPFIVDLYAVTSGSINENTEQLIEWIMSEQGQSFIEICGYVRR